MTKEQLQERIAKKEQDIAKKEKNLVKYVVDDEFTSICDRYFQTGDKTELEQYKEKNNLWWLPEYYSKRHDLEEAKLTLTKYQNALQVELAKENELENDKVDVIWNFLLNYKELVKDYIRDNLNVLIKHREVQHRNCDFHNNSWKLKQELGEEEYKRLYKKYHDEEKNLRENINQITSEVVKRDYSHYDEDGKVDYSINEEKLEEILVKDIKARYFNLIEQITKYVGHIEDASYLSIGAKGDLNGYVVGNRGKAHVETIGAGGYNIQRFHYRTIINPIK